MQNRSQAASIPYFQHAIELDPNFAAAYVGLGATYSDSESSLAAQYIWKAYDLPRDHLSPRERFYIPAHYFDPFLVATASHCFQATTLIEWPAGTRLCLAFSPRTTAAELRTSIIREYHAGRSG
jgi:hypothetical protein